MTQYECPKCGAPMRLVEGTKGKFWGCTKYQQTGCKGTRQEDGSISKPRSGGGRSYREPMVDVSTAAVAKAYRLAGEIVSENQPAYSVASPEHTLASNSAHHTSVFIALMELVKYGKLKG